MAATKTDRPRLFVGLCYADLAMNLDNQHSPVAVLGIPRVHSTRGGGVEVGMKKDHRADKNPRWNGGRHIDTQGYVHVWAPNHPHAVRNKVLEHRLIMERHLGRLLERGEVVHHINGDPGDNRIENLSLHASAGRHAADEHNAAANLPQPAQVQCRVCEEAFNTRRWDPRERCKRCRDRDRDRELRPWRYSDLGGFGLVE